MTRSMEEVGVKQEVPPDGRVSMNECTARDESGQPKRANIRAATYFLGAT